MKEPAAATRGLALALLSIGAVALMPPTVRSAQEAGAEHALPPVASLENPCPPPPRYLPRATGSVEGTVRDERTGLPLPDSRLLISREGRADGVASSLTFRTDEHGRFRLCRLPAGWTVTLRAERGGVVGPVSPVWVGADSTMRRDLTIFLGEPGELTGQLLDRETGESISGAAVRVVGIGIEAVTGDDGHFRLSPLPAGDYALEVEHLAYGPVSDSVTVRGGITARLALAVAPRALPVEPLVVTVSEERSIWLERTGFYRRRSRSKGVFFTREEILAEGHSRLSEVFRGLPGVRIRDGEIVMTRAPKTLLSGGRSCPAQHFVDGQAVTLPTGVDAYLPEDIAALELYRGPSETPMAFNRRRAACGVVVLWLRSRRD